MPRPLRHIAPGAVALVTLAVAACSGGGASPATTSAASAAPGSGPPVATVAADTAAAIISGFDFLDEESYFALHDNRADPGVVAAAAEALSRGVGGDELWAATFVWVNEGDDAEPLLALVGNDDVSIRIMAATGLLARGRQEGFGPLIDALTDDSGVLGPEPAQPAWYLATTSLMRFTGRGELGPPLDADMGRREAAQQRWRAWLADNGAGLTFDAEEVLWHAP